MKYTNISIPGDAFQSVVCKKWTIHPGCNKLNIIFALWFIINPTSTICWYMNGHLFTQTAWYISALVVGQQYLVEESWVSTSLWCQNGRDGVSNHQHHDCLINRLFRCKTKNQSSASLAFVRGIHRWPVHSPHKWPVTTRAGILITLLYNICLTNFRLIYKLALAMYFSNFVTYRVLNCWW